MKPDYNAPAAHVAGNECVFGIPSFNFESGEQLQRMKVGYVTHGQPNANKDNAILLTPGTANTRHSADGYIGAGKALDPAQHFIIAVDAIGAGTSSQPADGLGRCFPRYNIRDMVRAQHLLVTQGLGLTHLKAVVGASMGAFQALEWAIWQPQIVECIVLLVPAIKAGNIFKAVVDTALSCLQLDPHWKGGHYTDQPLAGLRAAGRLYYPWTVADAYLEKLSSEALRVDMAATMERAAAWDAWNFIRRYEASSAHDISVPFGGDVAQALGRIRSKTLVMPTTTDRLLGIETARQIARHVTGAKYVEVPSQRGHLGWRAVEGAPETRLITEQVRMFLGANMR